MQIFWLQARGKERGKEGRKGSEGGREGGRGVKEEGGEG